MKIQMCIGVIHTNQHAANKITFAKNIVPLKL